MTYTRTRKPAAPIARHLRALTAAGWSYGDIATAAGISTVTIGTIIAATQSTVHQRTATAILALDPANHPTWEPATGTVRRIQALAAIGWPMNTTAEAAGVSYHVMRNTVEGRALRVRHEVAAAVDAVFQERAGVEGPSERARSLAFGLGWSRASQWDDIDDPAAKAREPWRAS